MDEKIEVRYIDISGNSEGASSGSSAGRSSGSSSGTSSGSNSAGAGTAGSASGSSSGSSGGSTDTSTGGSRGTNELYYHKYIVYTDSNGNQYAARGGPGGSWTGFGEIVTDHGDFDETFIDFPKDMPAGYEDPSETILEGEDLSDEWQAIKDAMDAIESEGHNYNPVGKNSNSTVDEALERAGLPSPQKDDFGESGEYWSPGSGTDLPEGQQPTDDDFQFDLPQWLDDLIEDWFGAKALTSPLVFDLDGNGIDLISLENGRYWDIDEDGFAEKSGWISGNDGLLAIDLNDDGIINNHGELFGNQVTDGFSVLSAYDSNSDNVIDTTDTQFNDLLVWVDENSNGYSEDTELSSLSDLGITSINLNASLVDYEIAGNHITHESTFTINGQTQTIVDAWFAYDNTNSHYQEAYTLDTRVLYLPTLRGFGDVKHLHIAMSEDSVLLGMVEDVFLEDRSNLLNMSFDLHGKVEEIMYRWAGVDSVDPTSRGSYVDARKVEFLEAYLGDNYSQDGTSPDPGSVGAPVVESIFSKVFSQVLSSILVQTGSKYLPTTAEYSFATGQVEITEEIENLWLTGMDSSANATDENDVYILHQGTGSVVYDEDLDGGYDQIWVDALIDDVGMWGDTLEDIHIEIISTGDKLEFTGLGSNGSDITSRIEKIVFSDGTVIDTTQGLTLLDTDDSHYSQGSALDDLIDGRGGNDTLLGFAGNDTLIGGSGDDDLEGGEGNDTYKFSLGSGYDTIDENLNEGQDSLILTGGLILSDVGMWVDNGEDLHIEIKSSGEKIEIFGNGSSGTDIASRFETIIFSDQTTFDLTQGLILTDTDAGHYSQGSALNDVIDGAGGNDTLLGHAGNDTLIGGSGNDDLEGGLGDDTYIFTTGYGNDTIDEELSEGFDTLSLLGLTLSDVGMWVDNGEDLHIEIISTGEEIEIYGSGSSGTDVISRLEQITFSDNTSLDFTNGLIIADTDDGHNNYGSALSDDMDGRGGNDKLYGYAGNDTLRGGDGSDYLYGGDDDDILYGGSGVDMLYGQNGADIFAFDDISSDNIQDFDLSEGDKLDVSDLLIGYDPITDAITDFVQITESGSNSYLNVDVDGGADNFVHVAYIYNETGLTDEDALETSGTLITV